MAAKRAALEEWLALFGAMVGMPRPVDNLDDPLVDPLKNYYHELLVKFHPDKHVTETERFKARAKSLTQELMDVYKAFTDPRKRLDPPGEDDLIDHTCDSTPPTTRTTKTGRAVYLVTFSHPQGQNKRAPSEFTRQEFAELLVTAFEASVPGLHVEYLAVFQERHAGGPGEATGTTHFHASVKSDIQQHERVLT